VQISKYIRPRQCLSFVLVSPVISDVSQVLELTYLYKTFGLLKRGCTTGQ